MKTPKPIRKLLHFFARHCIFKSLRIRLYRYGGAKVGKNVFIGMETYIDDTLADKIIIEDDVTISFRVTIIAHGPSKRFPNPVIIKKGVYIGAGAILLPGLIIGESSVIGAGSVVTKDVPPLSLVAGNPARFVRKIKDIRDAWGH